MENNVTKTIVIVMPAGSGFGRLNIVANYNTCKMDVHNEAGVRIMGLEFPDAEALLRAMPGFVKMTSPQEYDEAKNARFLARLPALLAWSNSEMDKLPEYSEMTLEQAIEMSKFWAQQMEELKKDMLESEAGRHTLTIGE